MERWQSYWISIVRRGAQIVNGNAISSSLLKCLADEKMFADQGVLNLML